MTAVDLNGFFAQTNPSIFVVSESDFVKLDEVVEVKQNTLRMKRPPHDIVFLS